MNEITEMMADMVKNIALLLMEKDKELSMEQALSTVFNSDTYRKIMDERTGLYYQSSKYVFSFLEDELKNFLSKTATSSQIRTE